MRPWVRALLKVVAWLTIIGGPLYTIISKLLVGWAFPPQGNLSDHFILVIWVNTFGEFISTVLAYIAVGGLLLSVLAIEANLGKALENTRN